MGPKRFVKLLGRWMAAVLLERCQQHQSRSSCFEASAAESLHCLGHMTYSLNKS
jgi:hypothetical protein